MASCRAKHREEAIIITMKALVLEKSRTLVHKEIDAPMARRGETLVKVLASGLCSSDIPRAFQNGAYSYPLILGHEVFGEAVSGGKKENFAVYPLIPCKKCSSCARGFFNTCKSYDYIGSRRHGGFAEYILAPQKNLFKIPRSMDPVLCAITEPTAVIVHAAGQAQDLADKKVLIIGDGSMGLILSRFLIYSGCSHVYLQGKYDYKTRIAKSFGAKVIKSDAETLQGEKFRSFFDIVFELAGTNSAYTSAILAVKPHGEIFFIGNIRDDLSLQKSLFSQILRKEVLIKGCWNSLPKDWTSALKFLSETQEIKKIISHTFALKDGVQAMHDIYNQKLKNYIKAVFFVS